MLRRRILPACFLAGLAPLLGLTLLRAAEPAPAAPKLVVVISVDQLRADYLIRFRPFFIAGGFKRLLEGGTDFQNAYYRHALTVTAPGHAQILSGQFARQHGIIGNEWLDRDLGEAVTSVEDRDSPLVGIAPAELGPAQALAPQKTGRSPKQFLATTVGDELKKLHGTNSKVFAASNKDRSAILLGGHKADAAYWDELGRFVTSRFYRSELPAWVLAFNAERRAEAAFGSTWDRLLPAEVYDRVQGPDDAAGEMTDLGFNRVFPKRLDGGEPRLSPLFFSAYENAPVSTEVLGAFVQRALVEEKLGQHPATDLLAISFSQIDTLGHSYGPDSHEVMDAFLRLDRILAGILDTIDRQIGLDRCIVVLTGDHGVAPMPQRPASHPAGFVDSTKINVVASAALDHAFGPLRPDETWFVRENFSYHFQPAALAAKRITVDQAAAVVKTALKGFPGVEEVYTRAELLPPPDPTDNSLLTMTRRSYFPGRPRDAMILLKPYFLQPRTAGSNHGSPYEYDTHVPIVWFGAGIPKAVRTDRVGIDDIAPTLSALLGLPAPANAQGRRLF